MCGGRYCMSRRSHELVMMRREELLARKAWTLEDARIKHAIKLWEHSDRIFRLNPQAAPALHETQGSTTLPSAPTANTREKDKRWVPNIPTVRFYSFIAVACLRLARFFLIRTYTGQRPAFADEPNIGCVSTLCVTLRRLFYYWARSLGHQYELPRPLIRECDSYAIHARAFRLLLIRTI